MRVIIILYSITVLSALVSLILVSRDVVTYDTSMIVSMVETVVAAITIWMIVKRMRIARKVIIILNAIDIAIGIIFLAMELLDMTSFIGTVVTSALIIVYFATSRRVKAVMVNDFNAETVKDSGIPTMKDPAFWRNLILYYCIFSILGHWMEAGFCMLIRAGIVAGSYDPSNTSLWRDWLYPFPPDGVGFVACVLLLYPLKNWLQEHINSKWAPLVVSFIINALVCTLIEFCFGMVVNTQHQLWDYSDMAFNFMGQVVLQNSIGFGFASTVMTWAVYSGFGFAAEQAAKACDELGVLGIHRLLCYAAVPVSGQSACHGNGYAR